jgi:hypothetical protein
MRYRLSRHASEEIRRRCISAKQVDLVMNEPEQIVPEQGRMVYQSRIDFGGRIFLVRVVVVDTIDPAVVVTAYRTSKVAKYWRIT